jgi:hypothetical protein
MIQEIGNFRTEEKIFNTLENICSLYKKSERSKCDNFIEKNANELIYILVEESDPSAACTLLGSCV